MVIGDIDALFNLVAPVFEFIINVGNFIISFILYGASAFLNTLSFVKVFFIDFMPEVLNLFTFLPSYINYGLSILFYFSFVIFALNLIKRLPFF